MDLAYDHIQEESLPKDGEASAPKPQEQQSTLNDDFQEAYRAISASPWGAKIGGFFGNVVKQGGSVYRDAQQELSAVGEEATRGFSDLRTSIINRTRALSLTTASPPGAAATTPGQSTGEKDQEATPTTSKDMTSEEAIKESETVLSRLRAEASKRLKDIQEAEEAADEALLRFGSNIRGFLRDAISIAPPSSTPEGQGSSTVLFESKDSQGKRVIHTSRFDAQLHVIHTTTESFTRDPATEEYAAWSQQFDIEKKTEDISSDLAKYPELRSTMEKLVPDQIPYAEFWKRYYFLRQGLDAAEARRRDLLKAASAEEEVGWDEDSDDEAGPSKSTTKPDRPVSTASSTTIHPAAGHSPGLLKPSEPRKSNDEKSQADSDTSYDVVGATSGVPSQAPSSPKEARKDDDSDEDWE
ncbi:BSD domain protein [Pleurostoma richardsiae]|uniref:BSD domain protein n=1 Tax=Pleurostoma richardsiae TaxID=41990 RepID=A0AA38RMR3_9PEZI|nr:BSD domain protein [Pleurostoma richardsiae]